MPCPGSKAGELVSSFDDVRLLNVVLGRLERWYVDGLLCIGDAAHAMSPVGGLGSIWRSKTPCSQVLVPALRTGSVTTETLRRVQRRRWLPTVITQTFQRIAHRFVVAGRVDAEASSAGTEPPGAVRAPQRLFCKPSRPPSSASVRCLSMRRSSLGADRVGVDEPRGDRLER